MQAAKFNQLIKNPEALEKEHMAELQQLLVDFPYFQSAHMLLNLAAKRWDAGLYEKNLKRTAIAVSNRSHLFELLHKYEVLSEQPQEPRQEIIEPAKKVLETAVVELQDTSISEEIKQEIDILKATELAHEQVLQKENEESKSPAPDMLETEIAKQVVASIVDKEIINSEKQKAEESAKDLLDDFKPESFTDWLAYIKKNNGQPYQQIEKQVNKAKEQKQQTKGQDQELKATIQDFASRKQKNKALIDKIIDVNPGSIKIKEEQKFFQPDTKAKESLLENEHLVTETLAKIYALQGNTAKAIRAYQILSLKFPQKSVYFASLIQKLKNNE